MTPPTASWSSRASTTWGEREREREEGTRAGEGGERGRARGWMKKAPAVPAGAFIYICKAECRPTAAPLPLTLSSSMMSESMASSRPQWRDCAGDIGGERDREKKRNGEHMVGERGPPPSQPSFWWARPGGGSRAPEHASVSSMVYVISTTTPGRAGTALSCPRCARQSSAPLPFPRSRQPFTAFGSPPSSPARSRPRAQSPSPPQSGRRSSSCLCRACP